MSITVPDTFSYLSIQSGKESPPPDLVLSAHCNGEISGIAFSPDNDHLAFSGRDGTVRVWDFRRKKQVSILKGHTAPVASVTFSPEDGRRIASCGEDNTVKIWAFGVNVPLLTLYGHYSSVWALRFSPNGKQLVTASEDGTFRVWNAEDG